VISSYAWLIPAVFGLSAVVIVFSGRRWPKGGAEIGITAVSVALLLSVGVAIEVFGSNVRAVQAVEEAHAAEGHEEEAAAEAAVVPASYVPSGSAPLATAAAEGEGGGEEGEGAAAEIPEGVHEFRLERSVVLAPLGGDFDISAGMRIDGLTAMMFLLVTFVSLMVHIYSTGYMHGDPRYTYYYALLSMFTGSMLLLVIADNLLQLLVGWELVGVCSFLLIGFWWEEPANQAAAIKAFLTTKLGDVGLMIGVIALWAQFQTFDISSIVEAVEAGNFDQGLLTFGVIALFIGAVGKSAQFPLHTWLPDAMAGPTPVSALIHAATMVTAGVFLLARIYPVFQASPTAVTVVAVVGAITLFAMGLLALVQDDVKKVLAYSTISQLGYMVAALAFSYTAGIFHLFTHGFFKALLFLGAGSLIHSVHSNNMSDMGGLRKPMPWTFATFLIGSAALAAIPPLAGFFSKDEILVSALETGGYTGLLVGLLGGLGGLLTAFYMTRVLWLVFAGEHRGPEHPHESPGSMKWPLVALAVPAVLIGFVNLPVASVHPRGFAAWTMPSLEYFVTHPAEFSLPLALGATAAAVIGVLAGTALYRRSPSLAEDPMLHLGPVTTVLEEKYYLDRLSTDLLTRTLVRDKLATGAYWLNDHVIDRLVYLAGAATVGLGRRTYASVDQRGIDGVVNGVGHAANAGGSILRLAQSGNVQLYAGAMFVGVFVLGVLFAVA